MTRPTDALEIAAPKTTMQRFLDTVEKVGNMVPHPVIIFLILIGLVIRLSALLGAVGAAQRLFRAGGRLRPEIRQSAGVGTIVSLMLPYVVWIFVLCTALFAVGKVLGLPWGL